LPTGWKSPDLTKETLRIYYNVYISSAKGNGIRTRGVLPAGRKDSKKTLLNATTLEAEKGRKMIKHIVCWRLRNRTKPLTENSDAIEIKAALEDLRGKIPGLVHLDVGFDFSGKDTAADIVLYTEFESKEALLAYQEHPAHVAVGKIVRPRTSERRMIDYDV
jgi:hypothetical protein